MKKYFYDFDDGDLGFPISDQIGMDSEGHMMMRLDEHMAMDMDSGDIHRTSSWPSTDESDYFK